MEILRVELNSHLWIFYTLVRRGDLGKKREMGKYERDQELNLKLGEGTCRYLNAPASEKIMDI